MKKQWLLCALAFIQLNAFGQTEKGGKLMSVSIGTLGYNYQEDKTYHSRGVYYGDPEKTSSFNFALSPSVAWFIKNNFALGGLITSTFSYSNGKYDDVKLEESGINIAFGPQLRAYLSSGNKGKPFFDAVAVVGFLSGKSSESNNYSGSGNNRYTVKSNGNFSASIGLGYEHFITKNIGLFGELGCAYNTMKLKYESYRNSGDQTHEQKKLSFPLMVGLQVHLLPKEKKEKE